MNTANTLTASRKRRSCFAPSLRSGRSPLDAPRSARHVLVACAVLAFWIWHGAAPAAMSAESFEQLRSEMYTGADQARRLSAAGRLLAAYPVDALGEFALLLRTPVERFNESFQKEICLMLARRGDDASIDVIMRKQKENSERALWIVEAALEAVKDRARVSRMLPGLLTGLRAVDRELGFYLAGKLSLTEHKELFVKALVQERNRPAFEQAIESAGLLARSTRISGSLIANLDLVPAFEDRLRIAGVIGRSGDVTCVPALAALLKTGDEPQRCLALEALSLLKQEEALQAAQQILPPTSNEIPDVPARDRLRGHALRALLRFPPDRIAPLIAILLQPSAAFLLEDTGRTIESRAYLLDWLAGHPDKRYAAELQAMLAVATNNRYREAVLRALAATKDATTLPVVRQEAEKGDPAAIVALGEAGGAESESYVLTKLSGLMQSGLEQSPDEALALIAVAGSFSSSPDVTAALGAVAKLDRPPFSTEALKQLGRLHSPDSLKIVAAALGSPLTDIRRAACLVLAQSGSSSHLKSLDLLSRKDPSAEVRNDARRALTAIKSRRN